MPSILSRTQLLHSKSNLMFSRKQQRRTQSRNANAIDSSNHGEELAYLRFNGSSGFFKNNNSRGSKTPSLSTMASLEYPIESRDVSNTASDEWGYFVDFDTADQELDLPSWGSSNHSHTREHRIVAGANNSLRQH